MAFARKAGWWYNPIIMKLRAGDIGDMVVLVELAARETGWHPSPYSYAELVLIECGNGQPRTLANAFREPCAAKLPAAVDAMGKFLTSFDAMYGKNGDRKICAMADIENFPAENNNSLDALAKWASGQVERKQ